MCNKKRMSLFTIFHVLVICFEMFVLVRLLWQPSEVPPPTTVADQFCKGVARLVSSDMQGEHEWCVPQVPPDENRQVHLQIPVFGVTQVCAGDRAVEAHFASYELPPHMRPHVGTAMATMGVRPHQCRLVSESTVLKQRQMTVTSVIASPSYRGMGPFLPPPRMRHVSCKAPSLALTSSSQGTICFQGPGTLSVTIKDVISLATDRPALVGCDRFSDGTYEGMGVEVEAKDGSRVQVADLLPGFQPTITICHITQWSTA